MARRLHNIAHRGWIAIAVALAGTIGVGAWLLGEPKPVPFPVPLFSNILDMTGCGSKAIAVATGNGIEILQRSGGAWTRSTVIPSDHGGIACSSDGAFLADRSDASRSVHHRTGDQWTLVEEKTFRPETLDALYPGRDAMIVLPLHMSADDPVARAKIYRSTPDGFRTEMQDLDLGPMFDFARTIEPSAEATLDVDRFREGEYYSGTTLEHAIGAADGSMVLALKFLDATHCWIAWKSAAGAAWHFGRLPNDTDTWFITAASESTIILPVRATDEARKRDNPLVPYDVYRCRLDEALHCERAIEAFQSDHEAVVFVRWPLYVIQDEANQCYRIASINGGKTPCYLKAGEDWGAPWFLAEVDDRVVIGFVSTYDDEEVTAPRPLYDIPAP